MSRRFKPAPALLLALALAGGPGSALPAPLDPSSSSQRAATATAIGAMESRGVSLYRTRKFEQARVLFQKLTQLKPGEPRYWFYLGNTELVLGNSEAAAAAYAQAVSDDPELSARARLGRARALRKLGRHAAAFEAFRTVDDPGSSESLSRQIDQERKSLREDLVRSGVDAYATGNYEGAIQTLQQANLLGETPESRMVLGLAYYQTAQWGLSVPVLESVLESSEGEPFWRDAEYFLNIMQPKRVHFGFSRLFLQLQFLAGYNSNLEYASLSQRNTGGGDARLGVTAGSEFFSSGRFAGTLIYNGFYSEFVGKPGLRFIGNEGAVLLAWSHRRLRFFVTPSVAHQTLGSTAIVLKPTLKLEGERIIGNQRWSTSFSSARSIGLDSGYSYLSGHAFQVEPAWQMTFQRDTLSASLAGVRETFGDQGSGYVSSLPLSYWGYGLGLAYTRAITPKLSLGPDLGVLYQSFDRIPDSAKRVDKRFALNLRGNYVLNSTWSLQLSVELQRTLSTLSSVDLDARYSRLAALAGFTLNL